MTTTRDKSSIESDDPHWIEWLTGAICGLVVLAMIGWMAKEALTQTGDPPQLSITVRDTERTAAGQFRVMFDVANATTSTAAGVTVRGDIVADGATVESSDVSFDYVPGQSQEHGALLFRTDPAGKKVEIIVTGYTEP